MVCRIAQNRSINTKIEDATKKVDFTQGVDKVTRFLLIWPLGSKS